MIDISKNEHDGNVSARDISNRTGIPLKYLEQIIGVLCKTGFLKSKRGAQGGYVLLKKSGECTMGDIIRIMDGDMSSDYIDDGSEVKVFWDRLYAVLNEYVDSVTLKDIIDEEKINNGIYEYYI